MQEFPTFEELQTKMTNFNLSNYQAKICQNIKRIRKEMFEDAKYYCKENNIKNPYSSQSISELLGISYEYYKRLESYDKSKPISIKLFLKVVVLFDRDISEFLK